MFQGGDEFGELAGDSGHGGLLWDLIDAVPFILRNLSVLVRQRGFAVRGRRCFVPDLASPGNDPRRFRVGDECCILHHSMPGLLTFHIRRC